MAASSPDSAPGAVVEIGYPDGPGRTVSYPDERARSRSRLGRMGFADPDGALTALIAPDLALWDLATDAPADPDAGTVLSALSRTADPDQALTMLAGLATTAAGPAIRAGLALSAPYRARLLGLAGVSRPLAEHLLAHPDVALSLHAPAEQLPDVAGARLRLLTAVGADPDRPVTGSDGAPATLTGAAAVIALRTAYRSELALVAARDAAGEWPLITVTEALADLAGYVLAAGLAVARAELGESLAPCRLAIVAMGKTGGRELNYVSDVDVIFVGEPVVGPDIDANSARKADDQAALAAATRLAAGTIRICGQAAWQVDAALRPEGNDGALVRTLASHQAYYGKWASTWEFQALLKARPVAGDLALGQDYVDRLAPLVWTAAERPGFVADVQAMRRRVVDHLPSDVAEREIKLGPGGLRDVEFAVQLLQLVHGRAEASLHARATLPALAELRDGGFVGRDDADSLADAYTFLRATEHRLQLARLQRTHLVPDSEAAIGRLARALGFRPDQRGDAAAVFRAEWALHGREVRRLHEKLFYRPLLTAVARVPSDGLRLSPEQARSRLEALGYHDPNGALRHLEALTAGVTRRAALQRALLPVMLSELGSAPDPDAGLLAYRQVSDALGASPWFLRLLRDEGAVAGRLAAALGTSRYVANLLVRAPEALQMLASDAELVPRRMPELLAVMTVAARRQDDPAEAAHAIRSVRRQELLRIAFGQLNGLLTDSAVRIALTELADATLGAALTVARREIETELGQPLELDFAVIAMGRLGGQELGYGSDADVLFVYRAHPGAAEGTAKRANQVAEQLRKLLALPSTDPPLLLDANLRPEGRNGPLARSLDSYAEYYARWSSVWEAQALLRARFCAGDSELGERFIELIEPIRYPPDGLVEADVMEIRRIKGRVEAERLPRGADPHTHTKLGRGGLADIEWTAQLLQLQHAGTVLGLQTPSTLPALWAAAGAGLISAHDASALEAAWRLASRARDAVMLVRDRAEDQLPKPGPVLTAVGLLLGYRPGFEAGQLIDDYMRVTRRARKVVESVFYGRPDD